MAQRSLLRHDQLDRNDSFEFAQLVIDGYSGGYLQDGYLTGLVIKDGYLNQGATQVAIYAADGKIIQSGTGQVSFAGNVNANAGVDVSGAALTVASQAITQTGTSQVTFGGNVDAQLGLDVTGDALTVSSQAITQTGTSQVTFGGNVDAQLGLDVTGGNLTVALDATIQGSAVIEGDLTVNGTTTTIDTQQMIVTDPITVVNASGTEITSDWTGFSARDTDGYNRIGWSFDGYWAISVAASSVSQPDANPTRALAYMGAGDAYGDLSSTATGNSGAGAIGVSPTGGISSTNIQAALEELSGEIATSGDGTTSTHFTINKDASAIVDEDACLIMKGGDGTSLMEGYMCLITDAVNGSRIQLQIYDDAARTNPRFHVGALGATEDLDAYLQFNAGTGAAAKTATIKLDGTVDKLVYTATAHEFVGGITADNDLTVTGTTTANGNTVIGSDSSDTVDVKATIISNLIPTDDTYYLGDTTHRWVDGYFSFFTPTYYTPVGDVDSLEGHLKGIDAALADVSVAPPRGVYQITAGEASADTLDTSRAADQGQTIDLSGLTDAEFRDYIFIYHNGQLLYNDSAPRVNQAAVVNDVARQTGTLQNVIFSANVKTGAIIQIVDMR